MPRRCACGWTTATASPLLVLDDGVGFDTAELEGASGRFGIIGMRERVESLGGRFSISSSAEHRHPGGGGAVNGAVHRVLVADDHAPTRQHVRRMLGAQPDFEVCGEAADAPGAVATAVREAPDLCLLDIRMPGNGIAAAWEITGRLPKTRVVMLTVSRDDGDLFAALRAGASGYLLKDVDPSSLGDQLRTVMAGEAALPRGLVTRLVLEFRDRSPRRRTIIARDDQPPLTSREWEVLELLRQGATTQQIAERLSLSQATVRSHVAAILRKLRVPDRNSAIRLLDGPGIERAVEAQTLLGRLFVRPT